MKESTLRDILISYERKRDKAEKLLEQRKNDVYKQIPQVKEIEDEINKILNDDNYEKLWYGKRT